MPFENRWSRIGLIFIVLGCVALAIEHLVYGGILTEDNIVRESFFLPLGSFLTILGGVVLLVGIVLGVLRDRK
ncbi:hypothetical protein [Qingshengfaniella alkalisoli]|uniref:DUF3955 domain-containing protein n=1 Tax=Qingshengfaniella alkalisoli TaxID=2599296 RepID=A0A5B8J1J2_9RHOB|nr:hypothetical protein [Qingshengfaniella alkalisoli]QDY70688.1 hypothetical protein FPZ52_13500 [Qingshengfaniella alkalisoli]